jgi:hypothetical protein
VSVCVSVCECVSVCVSIVCVCACAHSETRICCKSAICISSERLIICPHSTLATPGITAVHRSQIVSPFWEDMMNASSDYF